FLPVGGAVVPFLGAELGFAEAEGIEIELVRDMTWATVRDRLLFGHTDAAHLIAPLAIAKTLGLSRLPVPLAVPFVLGLNGNAITRSPSLADEVNPDGGLGEPRAVGARMAEIARRRKAA